MVWLMTQALNGKNNNEESFITNFQDICLLKPWLSCLFRTVYKYCRNVVNYYFFFFFFSWVPIKCTISAFLPLMIYLVWY